ncbi:conserved hypothetical protein [Pediculus humanus corporis]|uniref:Uncharacterized protein n=1 Tax=Pediculus humanus subsp. corporis TaxID=121224 RepID=E0VVZ1_PEDHC|nr:uncharacterized protein Phum_PHUM472410 [Pediculus humanus corporis]EEB17547.1 conserved hypothetical protein [Pediculus humanus corporis]
MQRLLTVELIFIIIILILINSGQSLKCFVCRSDKDKACIGEDSNLDSKFSVQCPGKSNSSSQAYCRKIKQKLRFKEEGDYTYIRECAYEKSSRPCYHFKYIELATQEICECDSELCNRGYLIIPKIQTLIMTFFVWLLNYTINR